ncbi:MAG: chemotaxis protein CheX [Epsilonproteobacteria bacterium]|nr:chemotaxis protein CheX [Campylobacterota bacterium]
MTNTIQHSILIFHYNETILESRNTVLSNTIVGQYASFKERGIKGIFISLKNAPYSPLVKEDPHLANLVKQLEKVSHKIDIPIAIGDYKKDVFTYLKHLSTTTSIKLFQNIQTALLFFNPSTMKKELAVLIYDEDKENANKITGELSRLGYSIVQANNAEDFRIKASAKKYDMTITHTVINHADNSTAQNKSLALSKQLIINLPVFIDTAVNSLVTMTGLEAQKIKHEIRPFNEKVPPQTIIAAMKFKGDISGIFFLVFPKELALIALEAMLGESISADDTAGIVDGVAEFCNIITGAAKVIFSNKNLKVLFELPKTYLSLQVALADTLGSNGVWIDMQLDEKPFYMFITK